MGSRLLYYLVIIPLSLLPLSWLHIISKLLYFVIYRIFGYRTKVVRANIQNSLIHLSKDELRKVESQFYQHLCDLVVESLKNFTISEQQVRKRMIIENPEVADVFFEKGQDVIIVGGHHNAWELFALAMPIRHKHVGVAIYKPLNNKFFDLKMRQTREKYGLKMVPMKEATNYFGEDNTDPYAFILGSDQSPSNPQNAYWMQFLNQDTGVLFGAEKYAKEYNLPVVIGQIKKIKRGYYTLKYKLLVENPEDCNYGEITRIHTEALEKIILDEPQHWLWSHKRWKHKRPATGLKQDELSTATPG